MKGIRYILASLLSLISVANTYGASITKFSKTKEPTTTWFYMPAGEAITAAGVSERKYPVVIFPSETHLATAPIAVANYENIGINCSYHVATQSTHPVMVEILNTDGETEYTHTFEGTPNVELALGGIANGIPLKSQVVTFRFRLSDAYDASEIAHIDEIQIYGNLKPWADRIVTVLTTETSNGQAKIKWATVPDAVKYRIDYSLVSGGAVSSVEITADAAASEQTSTLTDLAPNSEYRYHVSAINAEADEIHSREERFNTSAGIDDITEFKPLITTSNGMLTISTTRSFRGAIYTTSGTLVRQIELEIGTNNIPMQAGAYILNQPSGARLILIR